MNNAADKKGILGGAAINLAGEFLSKFIILLTSMLITRLFPIDDAGIFFLGYSYAEIGSFVCMLGMKLGVVRFVALDSQKDKEKIRGVVVAASLIVVAVSTCIAIAFTFGSDYFINALLKKPAFAAVALWFAWALPFEALRRILLGALEGLKIMRYTMLIEGSFLQITRLILIFLLSYVFKMGIAGAAAGFLFSSILSVIVSLFFVNKHIKLFLIKKIEADYKSLIRFSLPMMPASILFNISQQLGVIMLGFFGSEASIAVFSICVRLCNSAEALNRAFQQISSPYFANISGTNNIEELHNTYYFTLKWATLGTIPIFLSFVFFSNLFIYLFFHDLNSALLCLSLLAATHLFSSVTNLSGSLIVMTGHARLSLINNTLFLICYFLISYFLIPRYDLNGAAVSHMISFFFLAFLRASETHRLYRIHSYNKDFVKILCLCLICISPFGAVNYYFKIQELNTLLVLNLSFGLFLFMVVWFFYLDKSEKKFMLSVLTKKRAGISNEKK